MTLAPRVQVYTQVSCNALYQGQQYGPSANTLPSNPSPSSIIVPDPILPVHTPVYFPHFSNSNSQEHHRAEGPRQFLSQDCLSDPAVQAGAARLQTTIATTTGLLTVCSSTWWGHYGQKHGRTPPNGNLGICFGLHLRWVTRSHIFATFGRVLCWLFSRSCSRRVPHPAPVAPDSVFWPASS